jgi:hypothetical protein
MVEMRWWGKLRVLASTQALLDWLPGDCPPLQPQELVRLRAGVLRFPSGAGAESPRLHERWRRQALYAGDGLLDWLFEATSFSSTMMSAGGRAPVVPNLDHLTDACRVLLCERRGHAGKVHD